MTSVLLNELKKPWLLKTFEEHVSQLGPEGSKICKQKGACQILKEINISASPDDTHVPYLISDGTHEIRAYFSREFMRNLAGMWDEGHSVANTRPLVLLTSFITKFQMRPHPPDQVVYPVLRIESAKVLSSFMDYIVGRPQPLGSFLKLSGVPNVENRVPINAPKPEDSTPYKSIEGTNAPSKVSNVELNKSSKTHSTATPPSSPKKRDLWRGWPNVDLTNELCVVSKEDRRTLNQIGWGDSPRQGTVLTHVQGGSNSMAEMVYIKSEGNTEADENEWPQSDDGVEDTGEPSGADTPAEIKSEPLDEEEYGTRSARPLSINGRSSLTSRTLHTTMGSSLVPHASGSSDTRPAASNPGPIFRTIARDALLLGNLKDGILVACSDTSRSQPSNPSQLSGPSQPSQLGKNYMTPNDQSGREDVEISNTDGGATLPPALGPFSGEVPEGLHEEIVQGHEDEKKTFPLSISSYESHCGSRVTWADIVRIVPVLLSTFEDN